MSVTLRRAVSVAVILGASMALASRAVANVPLTVVSIDPYTNNDSFHRTEVEPDTYSFGSTIVGTFQVGRTVDGGASNIGWTTSTDSGATWSNGFLPALTVNSTPPGPYDRASDPSVAYDAAHDVWLINSLAVNTPVRGVAMLASRSTNGGLTWGPPVHIDDATQFEFFDKNWITCDNWPASPFYGRCYVQWDNANSGNQLHMATSTDGGLTWHAANVPGSSVIGGQPVVQPNGRVVVPIQAIFSGMRSFISNDGGMTYNGPFTISSISEHFVAGNLRTSALPSAEVDGAGRVYVVWQDCRFRTSCRSNDIVMSTSTDGQNWTPVVRIPIDPVSSQVDHFIPGIAVDPTTSGNSARLGLTFYFYPDRTCNESTCKLTVGYISSPNGGANWTAPVQVAGPFTNTWLPLTSQGRMVGDYISTSWSDQGTAFPVFAAALSGTCSNTPGNCRETMVVPTGGLALGGPLTPVGRERPVASAPPRPPVAGLVTAN